MAQDTPIVIDTVPNFIGIGIADDVEDNVVDCVADIDSTFEAGLLHNRAW